MRRIRPLLSACLALLALPAAAHGHDRAPAEAAATHGDTPQEVRLDLAAAVESQDAGASSGLPTTWCGPPNGVLDDTVNAVHAPALPQFKLVYAYPDDRTNRFAQWAHHLQANASLIARFVAQQSGGLKAPRFDMGTTCGPQYVDIAVVALPGPASTYAENTSAVRGAVTSALGNAGGMRTPVIMADHLSAGGLWGVGSLYVNDAPGPGNPHNLNPTSSVIWIPTTSSPPASSASGYWPSGFLHEMTHNMGGVQWTAPHNSGPGMNGSFHCWDGYDLMCYADSGSMPHPYETSHCDLMGGAIDEIYDCGGDDYFNPSPAPGSYLASHWNVFDSVFLGDCATLGDACGGAADGLPAATSAPSVSGSGLAGAALTGSPGTWSGSPTLALQWQRGGGGTWQDIAGATQASFTPQASDAGSYVRLSVTATNASGSATATSAAKLVTQRRPPVSVVPPVVTGTPRTGQTLGATLGSWSGLTPMSFSYRWEREAASGWAGIAGATQGTYAVAAGDAGRRLRLRVQALNADGGADALSAPVTVVTEAAPAPAPDPLVPPPDAQPWPAPVGPAGPGAADPDDAPGRVRALRLRSGRRTLGRLRVRVRVGDRARATLSAVRMKAPAGRYRLRVCGTRCITVRPLARGGSLRLPPVTVGVRAGTVVRVTLKGPRWSAAGAVSA